MKDGLKEIVESVAQEGHRLVNGDRGRSYGHPLDDFGRTAGMLNSLFAERLADPSGFFFKPEDIAKILICIKLSREENAHKRDNLVDICGYAATLEKVADEKERRQKEEFSGCQTVSFVQNITKPEE